MAEFVVLLRENPQHFRGLSAAEMQAIIERYSAWAEGLGAQGNLVAGHKLRDDGGLHVRKGASGIVASSGPYAEAQDIVSGLFIIAAQDLEEARKLIADCPHLELGWIELREIEPT
jgi:hypothetical protein